MGRSDSFAPWERSAVKNGQVPVFRKPQKLFRTAKPFLVNLYPKTERCVRLKLLVWREPLFILRMWIKQLCNLFLWLSGCEILSGPWSNGPLKSLLSLIHTCMTDVPCYYSSNCNTIQIWSWCSRYLSSVGNRYPAVYVASYVLNVTTVPFEIKFTRPFLLQGFRLFCYQFVA